MGWLVRCTPLPAHHTPDSYLRELCTGDCRILKSAFVGSTWYAAADVPDRREGHEGKRLVVALVFLTSGGRSKFGYKDMDESAGPNACDCPAGILALLSPAEDVGGYSADWRARCRQRRQEKATLATLKPKPGARVQLAEPMTFRGGAQLSDFTIVPNPGRSRGIICKRTDGAGGYYRLPPEVLLTATITKGA